MTIAAWVIGLVPDEQGRIALALAITAKEYAALLLGHDPSRTLPIRIVDGPADLRVVHVERDPEDRRNGPVFLHVDGPSLRTATLTWGGHRLRIAAGPTLVDDSPHADYRRGRFEAIYLGRSITISVATGSIHGGETRRRITGPDPALLALGPSVTILTPTPEADAGSSGRLTMTDDCP